MFWTEPLPALSASACRGFGRAGTAPSSTATPATAVPAAAWWRATTPCASVSRLRQAWPAPEQEVRVENLEHELDRLYALEPAAFVPERERLVRELRDEGRREEAQEVKRLRKPTVPAWVINQLARQERREIDLLLDAGHRLREAQKGLLAGEDRRSLDEARQTERDALEKLRRAAGRILAEGGRGSDVTLNRIMSSLAAAAVSSEGRELLARGRLTEELDPAGFEALDPLAGRASPRRASPRRRKPEADRKRVEEARNRLRKARERAKTAEKDLRAAERAAEKARRDLARAEEGTRKSETAAAEARSAVEQAEQDLRDAERSPSAPPRPRG